MESISKVLEGYGLQENVVEYLSPIIMVLFIIGVSMLANFITKKVVMKIITQVIKRNKFQWDDVFLERKVFQKLSHIVPAIIIYFFAAQFDKYQLLIEKGVNIYVIIIAMLVLNSFLNAIHDIYLTFEISKVKPIKGFIQVAKIVFV